MAAREVVNDAALRALRLLADPAGPDRQQLAQLAEQVVGDERAAASLDLAVTIAGRLRDHGRRERELTALYETAGDLSSLRDLEKVLGAIVARARKLLGTEAAYLMLIDEARGDTYVRTTDGVETEAFKSARLAMGAGLGGLVAQTREPYATPNYPRDPRFLHTVDAIVNAEGLVAVLGVPLLLREKVIGVLFAAHRHERPFADAEVALLISLAAHAAIAIETASLFADVRAHIDLVERAAGVHERLTALVAQGGQLPDVAGLVAGVLDAPVIVADPALRVLATGLPGDGADPPAVALTTDAWETLCRSAIDRRATVLAPEGAATPVVAGSQVLAVLLAARGGLDDADLRTVERAGLVCAILLLAERQVAEAEQRVRGDLLDDLLADVQPEPDGLRRRARLLGIDLDRPHVVVVAYPQRAEDRRAVAGTLTRWAAELGGVCAEHDRAVVALAPDTDPAEAARRTAERFAKAVPAPVTVGAAGPGQGSSGLRAVHRDARQCVDVLRALDREGESASPADLGAFALLFGPAGRARAEAFVRRQLGPVLDYDAARGAELRHTIETFFGSDENLARTAAALFIHINTLYQRLERITGLLGEGWRTGDTGLQVHLAVKLHRIVTTNAG